MAESEISTKHAARKSISSKKSIMTPAEHDWQKNVLCRFYKNGMCNKGAECVYSHDRSLSNRGTLPCKYFSTGTCAYGDDCRFSHAQPFPGDIHNTEQDDQKIFLPQHISISNQFNMEDQHITPLYPPLLNPPQQVPGFVNDSTIIRQIDIGYEPTIDFPNFIVDDSHSLQHISPETNSFYNEGSIGDNIRDDSGVEDLTYQFDASLPLEQVPSAPEAPMIITPTGVLWAATGPYRSATPAITSPPPFSNTSWAEAPEFVPRNTKSPSVTMNSHNAIRLQSLALDSSSNTNDGREKVYSNCLNQEGQYVSSVLEHQPGMPLSFEKLHNIPQQLPSLIPSSSTTRRVGSILGARVNICNTGISLPAVNLDYANCMESANNYFPNKEQFLMSDRKYEMHHSNDMPNFTTHPPEGNEFLQKHNEMPPPPPPSSIGGKNGATGIKSSVPKAKTWAQVVNGTLSGHSQGTNIKPSAYKTIEKEVIPSSIADAESQLCPFSLVGECRYGEHCAYVHGLVCDLCGTPSLHPNHEKQRKRHQEECMNQHEIDMELSFAVARSKDKTCGICMEVVMDKSKGEARFGIMPNCNHCYCLSCLRKWRQAKQFEHKIIRACPECRQTSDYICPSRYWVDTKEEKEKLLSNYKLELKKKECKYFDKGDGECPFGNKCFYRHEDKNGKFVDVGPPSEQIINRPRLTRGAPSADDPADADGVDRSLVQRLLLFDFLEERDGRVTIQLDEFLDILDFLSDTEESEEFS